MFFESDELPEHRKDLAAVNCSDSRNESLGKLKLSYGAYFQSIPTDEAEDYERLHFL